MVDYLVLTAARIWDVFAAGVPNWTNEVTPGNRMLWLLKNTADPLKRRQTRTAPADFPNLSIMPVTFADQGFSAPGARTFANAGARPLAGVAPIVTEETIVWELQLQCRIDD